MRFAAGQRGECVLHSRNAFGHWQELFDSLLEVHLGSDDVPRHIALRQVHLGKLTRSRGALVNESSRKRAWNWRLRKRPLSRNWAKNERRAKKTACLIPNLLETRNRKKRARSGILQRRSLPRAARLFKRLSDGENEFFFKGPADDLHADRKALVGKADWDGCAGKAG